jgi:hypothetical protein
MKIEPARFARTPPPHPHASADLAAEGRSANWELDAALAVLQRARDELDVLPACEHGTEMHLAAQRRVQSAQQLVGRIRGKLA